MAGVRLSPVALLFMFAVISPAAAQNDQAADDGKIQGNLSLGVGLLPEFEGASSYMAVPYIEGRANDGSYFARFEGGDLQFNLIDDDQFHAGPLVGYRLGRGDVANGSVSRLDHIPYSIVVGGFLEYEHRAKDPRSGERVTLNIADGTINRQTGWNITLRALLHRPVEFVDPGLIATLEADMSWSDKTYMQTFFGINGPNSQVSGLPSFNANSALDNAGVSLSLDQFLSRNWSLGLRLHYARLFDDAADSPVTAIAGSPDQYFAGLVVGYVF